jgi:hypothetical protein
LSRSLRRKLCHDTSGLRSSGSLLSLGHLRLRCGHARATPGQVLHKQRQEEMRKLEGSQRRSGKNPPSFLKLTRIGCKIFWPTEANVSHRSLSTMVTSEHVYSTLSSTCLQLIDEDEEPGGPDRNNSVIPGPRRLRTRGLGFHCPGQCVQACQDWHHASPSHRAGS